MSEKDQTIIVTDQWCGCGYKLDPPRFEGMCPKCGRDFDQIMRDIKRPVSPPCPRCAYPGPVSDAAVERGAYAVFFRHTGGSRAGFKRLSKGEREMYASDARAMFEAAFGKPSP